ncbi:hypothetical protein KIN20_008228 [Parelaphostrongylus tenuis]|uniref:Uncharacterized protein n=1 Tax=Parelaphostrongylus tenuis TaxID=148309 RepID=A0AAD5MMJ2_PARTN|nr:hypothetical protein KIN20_008228 [Parelaphostrongylus tenuis]
MKIFYGVFTCDTTKIGERKAGEQALPFHQKIAQLFMPYLHITSSPLNNEDAQLAILEYRSRSVSDCQQISRKSPLPADKKTFCHLTDGSPTSISYSINGYTTEWYNSDLCDDTNYNSLFPVSRFHSISILNTTSCSRYVKSNSSNKFIKSNQTYNHAKDSLCALGAN